MGFFPSAIPLPRVDPSISAIDEAVAQGRKRLWTQLGARQLGLAATIGLAGPVVLLAVGAVYFPTAALWLFVLAGAACGYYLWRRARPGEYQVARVLDLRFATEDQISTAYYFGRSEAAEAAAIEEQRTLALRALAGHSVDDALPWEAPRTAWWAAGMFALAAALLLARFALQPTLSLEPPLTSVLFPGLGESRQVQLVKEQQPDPDTGRDGEEAASLERQQLADARPPSERPTPPIAPVGDEAGAGEEAFEMPEVEGLSLDSEAGDELSFDSEGANGEEGSREGSPDEKGSEIGGEEPGEEPEPSGDWSEESNSLLERLKDAFEKMVENLSTESPESSESASQEPGEGAERSEASEAGEQAEANAAGEQATDAEMEGGEPGEGEPQQAAQGGGANDSEQGANEGQSSSASGTAEGDKQIAEEAARQEAELDALEEFYMQRADELTGEIMVETTVAEQQSARTPMRAVESGHADRGGLVSRDEVPAAYREFVETYFQKTRSKER